MSNLILNTDSYKLSHFLQYPEGTTDLYSYVEPRGGADKVLFFGLQQIILKYLSVRITETDLMDAVSILGTHGTMFPYNAFRRIIDVHDGFIPVEIRALPEGTVIPTKLPVMTIHSTDPEIPWIGSYFESLLLRLWYPTSVATTSYRIKQFLKSAMTETCDNLDGLPFKLHDFGARGSTCTESSALASTAHLVNFKGTDTLNALVAASMYYNGNDVGFSVNAAEHSTITSWGRGNEAQAYSNMIDKFGKPGAIFAVVSDSYDIFNAINNIWGDELRDKVIASGATLVIRPDSGNPVDMVNVCLDLLDAKFGHTVNSKGYKVLNHVKIIQGDGINMQSIERIVERITYYGWSLDSVGFGMGGALHQGVNRDTYKWAMKCSAALINGEWKDVYKDPVTDKGKTSKKGLVSTFLNTETGEYECLKLDDADSNEKYVDMLRIVYRNGEFFNLSTFEEVRQRSEK